MSILPALSTCATNCCWVPPPKPPQCVHQAGEAGPTVLGPRHAAHRVIRAPLTTMAPLQHARRAPLVLSVSMVAVRAGFAALGLHTTASATHAPYVLLAHGTPAVQTNSWLALATQTPLDRVQHHRHNAHVSSRFARSHECMLACLQWVAFIAICRMPRFLLLMLMSPTTVCAPSRA